MPDFTPSTRIDPSWVGRIDTMASLNKSRPSLMGLIKDIQNREKHYITLKMKYGMRPHCPTVGSELSWFISSNNHSFNACGPSPTGTLFDIYLPTMVLYSNHRDTIVRMQVRFTIEPTLFFYFLHNNYIFYCTYLIYISSSLCLNVLRQRLAINDVVFFWITNNHIIINLL